MDFVDPYRLSCWAMYSPFRTRPRSTAAALLGLSLGLAGACLPATQAHAWGTEGHEAIVRLAWMRLEEPCLQGFYLGTLSTLVSESMAPDRWKGFDPDESSRHYLNIDVESDPTAYPHVYADAVSRYGLAEATDQGLVPWRSQQFLDLLVSRFAARDPAGVAAVSGQLGHYIGDAHSPLHSTLNFDGQSTGDLGLHDRWESKMPRAYRGQLTDAAAALAPRFPLPAPEPVERVFEAILSGLALMPAIVEADLRTRGTPEALYAEQGPMAAERWARAAAVLASLWTQAWRLAGSPQLRGMPAACASPGAPDGGVAPAAPDGGAAVSVTPIVGSEPVRVAGGGGCSSVDLGVGMAATVLGTFCLFGLLALTSRRRRRGPRERPLG